MNWSVIRHLAIAALVAYPVSALGEGQAPDVKGKWIGKTYTILVGKGGQAERVVGPGTARPCSRRTSRSTFGGRTAAASGA